MTWTLILIRVQAVNIYVPWDCTGWTLISSWSVIMCQHVISNHSSASAEASRQIKKADMYIYTQNCAVAESSSSASLFSRVQAALV